MPFPQEGGNCSGYLYLVIIKFAESSGVITEFQGSFYGPVNVYMEIYPFTFPGTTCHNVCITYDDGTGKIITDCDNILLFECGPNNTSKIVDIQIIPPAGWPPDCSGDPNQGGGGGGQPGGNNPPPPPPPLPEDDLMGCCDQVTADLALLKLQVQEIHQSLQATKYAKDDDVPGQARVANLGWFIERIGRVMGISVKSNGEIKSIRQQKVVTAGKPIPGGWNFGQWGLNKGGSAEGQQGGNSNEFRDGIVYEQRSNKAEASKFNPSGGIVEITRGDYVLCENIPQLLDAFWDDMDKAFGMQELGASAIPNADNSGKFCTYEGLAKLLTEIAYMSSRISQHTAQTQICSMVTQALANEILRSTGQPLQPKSFPIGLGGGELAVVPYLGLASDAMSVLEQWASITQTLAPILAAHLKTLVDKDGAIIT